uniref:helicase-related protein n=1 Tax=Escherichia coli TaxID=562 RepID=UPI002549465C
EDGLRTGSLKAVISTSALEMGVDIPILQVGLNVDGYTQRRSIRQRIGRVGRAAEGVFAILAEADQFSSFGESFEDHVRGEVEE